MRGRDHAFGGQVSDRGHPRPTQATPPLKLIATDPSFCEVMSGGYVFLRRGPDDDLLFIEDRAGIDGLFADQIRLMKNEIEALGVDQLLGIPVTDLQASLFQDFRIDPLQLDKSSIEQELGDVKVDISKDSTRMIRDRSVPFLVTATARIVHVPYSGDSRLFRCTPNTRDSNPPRARVRDGELVLTFVVLGESKEEVKGAINGEVARIEMYLGWQRANVENLNSSLFRDALTLIQNRIEKVKRDQDITDYIGIPVRRRSDSSRTTVTPLTRKRLTISALSPLQPKFQAEPLLEEPVYYEILADIQNLSVMIERSPSSFATLGEEGIRDNLLLILNGMWQGAATGETFNRAGKTDILIRYENSNLFVAECKIWKGPSSLTDAVDQLFGYVTWRDTKTALLVFNRNKDLSTVISKGKQVIEASEFFKREHKRLGQTAFCYVLRHPRDQYKEVYLSLMFFDVPVVL
jgi:hypothetical protein